jgi:hypothetical protein
MEAYDRNLCEAEILDRELGKTDKLVSPANP